jgi:hypothetical protein
MRIRPVGAAVLAIATPAPVALAVPGPDAQDGIRQARHEAAYELRATARNLWLAVDPKTARDRRDVTTWIRLLRIDARALGASDARRPVGERYCRTVRLSWAIAQTGVWPVDLATVRRGADPKGRCRLPH